MDVASARGSTGALSSSVDSVTGHSMHHSMSTPAGVDGGGLRTPPTTPKRGGKMLGIRVQMLDDTITEFQVQAKALGNVLFEQVCKQLHLLEADYFGLEYSDSHGTKYWLDLQKPISRQLGLSLVNPLLFFCVKFYTPDPAQLEEEYTRYLFCLQVKRDLAEGIMQCNENTAALMASYLVQAECGDFVPEDYPDHSYLSSYKFVPQQDREMEKKIMENHKKHTAQSPAEADLNLLETARRCEMYGMKMHPAKDNEGVPVNLSVAHMGIVAYQNLTKINTFSWAKIRKISFKRKKFLIKLHPENSNYYKDTVEFVFECRNESKNFWKKCVENHGFFRCAVIQNLPRQRTRVLSRGSSFRYSGKTQKQIVEFVRDNYVKRQTFQRSHSFRHSSAHSSASNVHTSTVGNSISAHPLLPLADSNLSVEASKLSASLGTVQTMEHGPAAVDDRLISPTMKSVCRPLGTATSWSSVTDTLSTSAKPSVTVPRPPAAVPMTSSPSPTEARSDASSQAPSPERAAPTDSTLSPPLGGHIGIPNMQRVTTRTPFSFKSDGNLSGDRSLLADHHHVPTTVEEDDEIFRPPPPKRKLWQRSASCRDLYDFSFEETGKAKRRAKLPKPLEKAAISLDERKQQDSPVTVYDDRRMLYSRDNSLEIQQDIIGNATVYSNCFVYSQESVEDPGNYDLKDSQEDLSHDSYELIEKSDSSGEFRKNKPLNVRSCSLDSGHYIPSESESDHGRKFKSQGDLMEDPRDFPREIVPRKSDGNFYKMFKTASRASSVESRTSRSSSLKRGSRTSSQESNNDNNVRKFYDSRTSSLESKSEYFDATTQLGGYDRKITFERNYGTQMRRPAPEPPVIDYVETEQSIRVDKILSDIEQNTLPQAEKISRRIEPDIFSFEEDHIQSMQDFNVVPNIDQPVRQGFIEIEPRPHQEPLAMHQPIERTKSDPNSLAARQKFNPSSRRLLLMHQKSIDLTPAESSDEDYLYKQIPSAPPITKFKGTHFEMPVAEFGHFDILKREGQKTKFEVPKSQFEVLGAKNQADLLNLPPKDEDIPYVLHKRHIMNGTAQKEEITRYNDDTEDDKESSFLFTQNIDLSKVNPITLEVDKTFVQLLESPKRDITHIDPLGLETLNSKLSQIESDSPTSSRTESVKPLQRLPMMKPELKQVDEKDEKKSEKQIDKIKSKRVIKPRMQPGVKKGGKPNKTKVRITSFSSDDESLDSDDVFGSTEATPTKMEFSPPQMRKEMESILKYESERKYLQYTMSSTEVEGSPPTTRRKQDGNNGLDVEAQQQTELRRISERSLSIPSSEDELMRITDDLPPVFGDPLDELKTVDEEEKSLDETLKDEASDDATLDEEREREKARLNEEIESDIKNLQVPPKTKITEIVSPSIQGQSPMVFAQARLNLSEGSAFSLLQKQQALDSPLPSRRARSLDAPVIPVHKLPPLNAFSSKDDTLDEEDQSDSPNRHDQIVPEFSEELPKLPPKGVLPQQPPAKETFGKKPQMKKQRLLRAAKPPLGPKSNSSESRKTRQKLLSEKASSADAEAKTDDERRSNSLTLQEIKRTKSQEMEPNRKHVQKEKAKSLEKLELKRLGSKDRAKSQEESDEVIAERRKLQQMLYETAIKQTKTLKSPVKDVLPVFPQVEETVRERGGKLEISINTIEPTVSLEEAIIVTKSPKKLDKKYTKSLELNLNDEGVVFPHMTRLGKSLDLERSKSEDEDRSSEFDFKPETIRSINERDQQLSENVILEGTSLDVWLKVSSAKTFENIQIVKSGEDFFESSQLKPPPDDNELQRATRTVGKFLRKKLEAKRKNFVQVRSEDESLTEVSELKQDTNLLTIADKEVLRKLSSERSKSDDTASWMTLDYDETISDNNTDLLNVKESKLMLIKRGSDQSKSSDTGSWTSGEKEPSTSHVKDTTEDSSASCSMGRAIGLSQNIEKFSTKDKASSHSSEDAPKSPRSPRICILGRAFTIDEGSQKLDGSSSEDEANEIPNDKKPYPFEAKWSNESEFGQKLQQRLSKKLSSVSMSSVEDASVGRRVGLLGIEKLSTESRNSIDTESSSGSLGIANRTHKSEDIPKELSSTWRPFPLDSSESESFDDNNLNLMPTDQDEYFLCKSADLTSLTDVHYQLDDSTSAAKDGTIIPEDLAQFNYLSDVLGTYSTGATTYLSRTLSRISERSTNSEKSSLEEDSTKASTQSDDESGPSSNPQMSPSWEEKKTPTNNDKLSISKQLPSSEPTVPNLSSLLQRQISDDRRTSAEMAELSIDDIEIISERGLRLKRQNSDDTIIDEECFEEMQKQSSQESEDWPLPEIPAQVNKTTLLAMHELPSSDTSAQLTTQLYQAPNIPKTFGLRNSLKSQESEQWPSPPSSLQEAIVENVETFYISPPEEACRVTVESSTYDNDSNSDEYRTMDFDHVYENVAAADLISESLSDSQSISSGVKIVLEEQTQGSSDDDLHVLNDDVFLDAGQLRPPTALRKSTASDESRRSSPAGSYSDEDCTSSLGTNLDGTVRFALKPSKCTHSSHSEDTSIALSLSEWSNSTNTVKFQNLSNSNSGTKSSSGLKSDENSLTDIAHSISEWSSTQSSTLKAQQHQAPFQKLSSSTGESTLTELIPSISEWSERAPTRLGSSVDIEEFVQDQRSPKNIPSEDFSIFSASVSSREATKLFSKSTERPMIIPPSHSDTDSSVERKTVHTQRYDKEKKGYLQKYSVAKSTDRPVKVNLKLSKCSSYYSSSLSSESTPLTGSSPIPMSKTATVPLTRVHKRPVSRNLTHAKSPPSENDSTSSVESPKSKSERERRGYRRKRQLQQQRHKLKVEKELSHVDEYLFVEHNHGLTEYNEYIRERNMEEMASNFQYESALAQDQTENLEEEGYYPDGDSQSGSDIFRMEKDEDEQRLEFVEGFDVSSIPPPLLEDDFEGENI